MSASKYGSLRICCTVAGLASASKSGWPGGAVQRKEGSETSLRRWWRSREGVESVPLPRGVAFCTTVLGRLWEG